MAFGSWEKSSVPKSSSDFGSQMVLFIRTQSLTARGEGATSGHQRTPAAGSTFVSMSLPPPPRTHLRALLAHTSADGPSVPSLGVPSPQGCPFPEASVTTVEANPHQMPPEPCTTSHLLSPSPAPRPAGLKAPLASQSQPGLSQMLLTSCSPRGVKRVTQRVNRGLLFPSPEEAPGREVGQDRGRVAHLHPLGEDGNPQQWVSHTRHMDGVPA